MPGYPQSVMPVIGATPRGGSVGVAGTRKASIPGRVPLANLGVRSSAMTGPQRYVYPNAE